MRFFIGLLFLIPGSLPCPALVTGPSELAVGSGSCLYIPCRYDLCQAGSSAHLELLRWLRHPRYDREQREFTGLNVGEPRWPPGARQGDCGLVLPRVQAKHAGLYGLRLMGSGDKLRWMHYVNVTVTETPPPPHLWPDPAPLTQGHRVTLGCWVPPSCPDDPRVLTWEGPVTKTPGVHVDTWTPLTSVTPHPVIGISLTFDPLWHHDGTLLKCLVWGRNGRAVTLASRQLQVNFAPRDVRVEVTPASPVFEGQEVMLRCLDEAQPPSHTYTWSLDGRSLPSPTAQLLLSPSQPEDGGTYRCRATNAMGTTESSPAPLQVYCESGKMAAVVPPRAAILEPVTSLPALVGSLVTLRCALGPAHPAPSSVQWLREDRWEADTPGPTLTFTADPARAGSYRCGGQNPAGSARSPPLSVVVWYPPTFVRVLQSPEGPVLAGGGPVRLSCQTGGAEPPKLEITWLKGGEELPGSALDFVLPDPQPPDAAPYVCQARNRGGVTRSPPLFLDVHFAPRGVELAVEPGGRVEEGSDVTLRCHGQAHPAPTAFEWFWEGGALGKTPQGLWVLPKVGPPRSGRYRCRVTNAVASGDSQDVVVTVYYSPSSILRRTLLGLGLGLSLLLLLSTLGCLLRRRWRRVAADEEPVVEPAGTFFLRHAKCHLKRPSPPAPPPRDPQVPQAPDEATGDPFPPTSPPGGGSVPRLRGDSVVYTVLKRSHGATKATEGPDYENVLPGPEDRDGDREGTLDYVTLALSSLGTPRGPAGDVGDTVEYAALRH
ncbi:LOW QUALITY PROTEIN: B-cell receptor CD22 [Podargus strigoides]